MKYFFPFLLVLFSCSTMKNIPTKAAFEQVQTFEIKSSIRAIEVLDEKTVWFAGSGGQYGFTEDAGVSWTIDSIKTDSLVPHFRSIARTKEAMFLLSIASPALLYKTVDKGKNWEVVYRENHPDIFYDSMAFWDDKEGIAMGDPTEGCLSVILTKDGGDSWQKIPCEQLPPTAEGEAAFAASNSNIALYGDNVWLVSGGKKARVFHSSDRGQTWAVYDTPIVQGGKMTGIFSTHFYDENTGIIFGGNWEKKEQQTKNKAITKDGGRTWQLVGEGQHPGYRSCVQYLPLGKGKQLLAIGSPGISYSQDGGNSWKTISDKGFYTVRFSPSGRVAWMAGDGVIGKVDFGR